MRFDRKNLWSLVLTGLIIMMLVFSGPASAATMTLYPPSTSIARQGDFVNFTLDVDFSIGELSPGDIIKLVFYNGSYNEIWFYPNGSVVNSTLASVSYRDVTYGYGYGYGYGGLRSFTITVNTSWLLGDYTVYAKFKSFMSGYQTLKVYATVEDKPPVVNIIYPEHLANLSYLDNWIVAEIKDDYGISNVTLWLNGNQLPLIDNTDLFWSGTSYARIVKNVSYTENAWNNITILAKDTAGNTTNVSIRVWVNPKEINITIPTLTEGNETSVNAKDYANFEMSLVPSASDSNVNVTVKGDVDVSNFGIGTNADYANNLTSAGLVPIMKFVKVEVSGTNVSSSSNISRVEVRLYYLDEDLDRNGDGDANDPGDINENELVIVRFCNITGEWEVLEGTNVSKCNGTLTVYNNGVNTSANYVWARLSHLSVFGLGGSVIPPAAAPVSAGVTPHSVVVEVRTMDGITATAGETIKVKIPIYSESQEPNVDIFLKNLPEGWKATSLKGITLPKGYSEAEILVTIPEDAEGTYNLTAVVKTWFGEVSSREFSITVTKPGVKPVEEVKPTPPEEAKPPEVKPPTKPPEEIKPPEEVKPPKEEVEKITPPAEEKPKKRFFGICGPSVVALLSIAALAIRRKL